MNINLLPLFASNVFYFNIDEDTSELDPNHFEFLRLGGNNFASSVNAYSTASVRVLEKYPNTKKIILDKFKEIAKDVLGYDNDFKIKKIPEGGGFHNWHFEDNNIQNSNRYFVVQIYLNEDFEGGETEFLYFNKRIKPKQGRLVIFPCAFTHTHRGNPPIGGTKYLASTWGLMQSRIGNNKSEY